MNYEEGYDPCSECENSDCVNCEYSGSKVEKDQIPDEDLDKLLSISVKLNKGNIIGSIQDSIRLQIQSSLKIIIRQEFENIFRDTWKSKVDFKEVIREILVEKFNTKYPDVVENKVNELAEEIKRIKIGDGYRSPSEDVHKKAMNMVDSYIQNELKESVKKTKDQIEDFAKQYFVNNLFKAMGIMDKMMLSDGKSA